MWLLIVTGSTGILIFLTLSIRLYRQQKTNRVKEETLKSHISSLEKELSALKEKNLLLEQENTRFQEKNFEDYKKILFPECEFDRKTEYS